MSNQTTSVVSSNQPIWNAADILPLHSGIYLVDRGPKLGQPLRYFDVDLQFWSRCCYDMDDLIANKNQPSAVGLLPWRGPVKVKDADNRVVQIDGRDTDVVQNVFPLTQDKPAKVATPKSKPVTKSKKAAKSVNPVAVKSTVKVAKVKVAKVKPTKVSTKVVHPDGTIFYRADRNKWVAMLNGKQECARDTIEKCQLFLAKKDFTGTVVVIPQ